MSGRLYTQDEMEDLVLAFVLIMIAAFVLGVIVGMILF